MAKKTKKAKKPTRNRFALLSLNNKVADNQLKEKGGWNYLKIGRAHV